MKFWTEERNAILREKYPRCITADLAKELGASPNAVKRQAGRLGVVKDEGYRSHKGRVFLTTRILEALEMGPLTPEQLSEAVDNPRTLSCAKNMCKDGRVHMESGRFALGPSTEPAPVVIAAPLPAWMCPPVPAFRGVVRAVHTCRGEE